MFKRIMVPVDLHHKDKLAHAVDTAGDLAKLYGASLIFVGATGSHPTEVAGTPEAYAKKLEAYAAEASERIGVAATSSMLHLHDVALELNGRLAKHASEIGADLIVMASHVPGLGEYVFGSHGGEIAQHAKMSVMLVRG